MEPSRVLAVCTANICRSPLIELLLRSRLPEDRFEVRSAGVRGWRAAPVDGMVRLEMARLGIDPSGFESRALRAEHVAGADLVLTATREHRGAVLEVDPGALRRTFTLLEFAALAETSTATTLPALAADAARRRSTGPAAPDVPDPYGRPPAVHREVADLVDDATRRVAAVLAALPVRSAD